MRVDELRERLAQFPGYWEVKAGGRFVTEVLERSHVVEGDRSMDAHRHADMKPDVVMVVVVIA